MKLVIKADRSGINYYKKKVANAGSKANAYFVDKVHEYADPYTPFDTGRLKSNVKKNRTTITYNQPYAKYQYHKWYNNYHNNESGLRGPYWIRRMWIDKSVMLRRVVSRFITMEMKK